MKAKDRVWACLAAAAEAKNMQNRVMRCEIKDMIRKTLLFPMDVFKGRRGKSNLPHFLVGKHIIMETILVYPFYGEIKLPVHI